MTTQIVLRHHYRFERGSCEIHVAEHHTSQGEQVFRAAAYAPAGEGLQVITDDAGVPYEVLAQTPGSAAERLADMLALRFGRRLGEPEESGDA